MANVVETGPVGAVLLIIAAPPAGWGLTRPVLAGLESAMNRPARRFGHLIAVSNPGVSVLGSVLEGKSGNVCSGPLCFRSARAVGVHEAIPALIIILAMGSDYSRRVGVGYFAPAHRRCDPAEGIRPIGGYLLARMIGLVIVEISRGCDRVFVS